MQILRYIIGSILVAIPFILLIGATIVFIGGIEALILWGSSIIMTGLVVGGLWLLVN